MTTILVFFLSLAYASLFVIGWRAVDTTTRLLRICLGRVMKANPRDPRIQIRRPWPELVIPRALAPLTLPLIALFWLTWTRRKRRQVMVKVAGRMLEKLAFDRRVSPKDARAVAVYLGRWLVFTAMDDAISFAASGRATNEQRPVTCGRCGAKLPLGMWGHDHDCGPP